jgi:hypothetical protein
MVPQTLIGKEIAGWNFGWNVLDFKQIVTEDCFSRSYLVSLSCHSHTPRKWNKCLPDQIQSVHD